MTPLRRITRPTLAAIAGALVVGCGVPTGDSSFDEIPPAEIPFGLNAAPSTT